MHPQPMQVETMYYGRYGAELELLKIGCFKAFEERCRAFARRIYATKVKSRPDSPTPPLTALPVLA